MGLLGFLSARLSIQLFDIWEICGLIAEIKNESSYLEIAVGISRESKPCLGN
jgi:hypothetical protein